MTISETFTIIVTLLLSYWVNLSFRKFEKNTFETTNNIPEKILSKETNGLGYIYREVRRARNHNHPIALLAIEIDEKCQEPTNSTSKKPSRYAKSKEKKFTEIGNILCNELEDCAIVVQEDCHFLVALPETKPNEVPFIIERIKNQVIKKLNTNLRIGSASLPIDGYTFEGLFEKATSEIKVNLASQLFNKVKKKSSEYPVASGKN
ncbi:MAG: hypothetical protein Q7U53_15455 [Anaerolineaceae bacterium]|nr:hypothetical protein [Anaerolineaceae bacterium]